VPSLPITTFTIPAGLNYCIFDTVRPLNTSANVASYTYTWKLDGTVFSTQYNASLPLNVAGTHTLSLTISNSYGSSTASKQVVVTGHALQYFALQTSANSVCTNNTVVITIPNSQTGTTYRLRNGFQAIGGSQNGNGGALSFSTTISATTQFNVLAVRSSFCYTDSLVIYQTVTAVTGGPKAFCIPGGSNTAGITNVTFNTINNSTVANTGHYQNYACLLNTNVIPGNTYPFSITTSQSGYCGVWIDMDTSGAATAAEQVYLGYNAGPTLTGSITIPQTARVFNRPLRMRVGYDLLSTYLSGACPGSSANGEIEDYSITLFPAPAAPSINFTYSLATVCNTTATFSNTTINATSYYWDFGDGNSSTLFQPTHVYTSSGTYTVKLIASNAFASDSISRLVTIQNALVPVTAACTPASQTTSCSRVVMSGGVQLNANGTYYSIMTSNGSFYVDLTCTKVVPLALDSTGIFGYGMRDAVTGTCTGNSCVWIDWNGDGVFNETPDERLYNGNISGCPFTWLGFTVPHNALLNTPLRVRILSSSGFISNSCSTLCGQCVEFTVIVHSYGTMNPNFNANITTACTNAAINFTSTSSHVTSYDWDFGDGSTSAVQNPSHAYANPGFYDVKLKVYDASSNCDSIVKFSYIYIRPTHYTRNPVVCAGQSYTVGTHQYNNSGTYTDSLLSSTGCDSIITTNLTVSPLPVALISTSGPTTFCAGDSVILSVASAGFISWQWYRGNNAIAGATSPTYTVLARGNYSCRGYNAALCASSSNVVQVFVPCVQPGPIFTPVKIGRTDDLQEINIAPNPGSGLFRIQSPEGKIIVYNVNGAVVFMKELPDGYSEMDLSSFPDGMYFVVFRNEEISDSLRLILAR